MRTSELSLAFTNLCHEVEAMMAPVSDRLERLTLRLRSRYPTLSEEVPGAVGHAIEKLITSRGTITAPLSYLAVVSENELKKIHRIRSRSESLEALREQGDWEPVAQQFTTDEEALMLAVYDDLIAEVESWQSGGVQLVTVLYLEHIFWGDPLSSSDAARLVSAMLGETVGENSVRTWKSRGFRRLRHYFIRNYLEITPTD